MNKLIERKDSHEYPGLTRIIQILEGGIAEIEFNYQLSNEIGVRFWKHFTDLSAEMNNLKKYIERTEQSPTNLGSSSSQRDAMITLLEDAVAGRVSLPDDGFQCKLTIQELKNWLQYI